MILVVLDLLIEKSQQFGSKVSILKFSRFMIYLVFYTALYLWNSKIALITFGWELTVTQIGKLWSLIPLFFIIFPLLEFFNSFIDIKRILNIIKQNERLKNFLKNIEKY